MSISIPFCRNRSGMLLAKEMKFYETKFELFKFSKPYSLENLAPLLDELKCVLFKNSQNFYGFICFLHLNVPPMKNILTYNFFGGEFSNKTNFKSASTNCIQKA